MLQHSVTQIVHHFLKVENVAYKLQPGGPGYEIVHGTTGVNAYLLSLTPKNDLKATFEAIAVHEQTILEPLMSFLTDPAQKARGVRIVGEETVNLERVPTVSFVVVGQRPLKSRDIVDVFDQKGGVSDRCLFFFPSIFSYIELILFSQVGIRYGHFYAYTLVDELSPKLDTDDGVVRISLVHYNTVQEVNRIIEILKEILA